MKPRHFADLSRVGAKLLARMLLQFWYRCVAAVLHKWKQAALELKGSADKKRAAQRPTFSPSNCLSSWRHDVT